MAKFHSDKYIVKNRDKYLGENINNIRYRSSWEQKYFEMLDNHPAVTAWASEVISIKYRHPFTKTVKSYLPDLYVEFVDANGRKRVEIIEIKPLSQSDKRYAKSKKDQEQLLINTAKWSAARAFCKKHGVGFKIITEKEIFAKTKYSGTNTKPKRKR